jgi:hypothetical protein
VVSPQNILVNERIGYTNTNYLVSYSQPSQYTSRGEVSLPNSTPYMNLNVHNSASHVNNNSSQINENITSMYSHLHVDATFGFAPYSITEF